MSKKKILIIGSSNTDMVIKAEKIPRPGETILGGTFLMNPGGKGANQAVSAARLDGNVTFIGKRGNDLFGDRAIELFIKEGIDVSYVVKDPELPSGVAIITVDASGENSIAVARVQTETFYSPIFLQPFLRLVNTEYSSFSLKYQ